MDFPIISADSHVVEGPNAYLRFIDPAFRDRAPNLIEREDGVVAIVDKMPPIKIGVNAAAGVAPEKRPSLKRLSELHTSGWDPKGRVADQDRDGVSAEIIYPSLGMILCNHPDMDYKVACFEAYNRWVAEYCETAPNRLLGCGQTAVRTPEEGIKDLQKIKALGLRGVLLPGTPGVEDYDSKIYDPFWEAAVDLGLPLSFHIVAAGGDGVDQKVRGSKLNTVMAVLRGIQDLLGMIVLGGVFERHPKLKLVCVEADAGWLPHYLGRLDRGYVEHRHKYPVSISRPPSEYFKEHIYLTFQDDFSAWKFADSVNWKRLMWANDFPHSDATWPNSQKVLAEHGAFVRPEQKKAILCSNVAGLYGIDLSGLPATGHA